MNVRHWQILLAATLLFLGGWALRHVGSTLSYPWPVEYGEGVNLHWAREAAEGRDLYPPVDPNHFPWVHNPYPPLGHLMTLPFHLLPAHSLAFLPGRLLALSGTLLGAGALFIWCRRHADSRTARMAAVFWCLTPAVLRYGVMMRVDTWAVGCALAAFVLTDHGKNTRHFALAGLLGTAAVLTKPTLLAAGLVLGIRLLKDRKPSHLAAAAAGAGLICVLVVLHPSVQGAGAPLQHLWTLQRLPWSAELFLSTLSAWAGRHAPLIALGAAGLVAGPARLRLYAGVAILPVLATLGIPGSDQNYFLELSAILCMASVCILPRLWERNAAAAYGLLLLQVLLWVPIASPPVFTRTYGQEMDPGRLNALTPGRADREVARQVSAELSVMKGPVLSSSPGLQVRSHPLTIQLYQFGKLIESGAWPDALLRDAITRRQFAGILLKGDAATASDPYLPPDLQPLVAEQYHLHRVLGPWHLYLPMGTKP